MIADHINLTFRYDGSPPLKVEYCNSCSKEMENKKSEISRFQELQVLFSRSPTNNQLALSRRWYDKWLKYVNGQAEYPGEIDNSRICDSDDKRCVAKYDPSGKMYMKVSVEMWKFLHDKYRGGPEVHVIQPSGEPQRGYREQRFPNYSLQAMSSSQPEDGNHSLELNKTEPALEADGRCHVSNQWYDNTDYTKNKEYPDDLSLPTNTQSDSMSYGRKALNYFKTKYGTFSAWTSQPEPGTRRELMMHTETHDDGTHVTSEDSLKEICVSIHEEFQQLGKEANESDFVYCINKEWWKQFEAYTVGNDGTEKPGMIDNKFIARQVHEATHIDGALRITGKQWILLSKNFGSEQQEPVIIRIRSQEGDMDVDSEDQPHPSDEAAS
ncbi:uncharacterized protein LOC106171293 isoform X3 [Lingula anatina]|uniref:Uncharacterized protein LOC106171293 isoform X3 n=1 Tax=Lingula anatina TaxID=7574 RepID=A0A1S3J9F4_LINAN|nr:uncharacterized protein LOC106171293 isoform X3 [Lingula anatina]|eukprot:XP_013407032.1 uncharacterized protein LOC106171293 isoform X3 [Lingula anatina]